MFVLPDVMSLSSMIQVPDRVLADEICILPWFLRVIIWAVDTRSLKGASFADNNLHPAITAITDCLRQNLPSYANSSFTTSPLTSVSRKSRPWKRYVSFV
jgi:hypothetical protein